MGIFAGILSRNEAPPDVQATVELLAALGRSGDEPHVFRDRRLVLARIEPSAIDAPELHETASGVTASAGLPLLGNASLRDDLDALAPQLAKGRLEGLARCRGQFALAHWAPAQERLVLATDFVGLRPVYVLASPETVVFSTALRVIEAMPSIPLRTDLWGVTEQLCIGVPLADRSPYADVRRLRSGEAWVFDAAGVHRCFHSRMGDVAESPKPLEELAREAYERFLDAVRIRAGDDPEAITFLSGGLDSRCLVGALVALGKPAQCVNIVRPGRLDTVLARRFAAAAGTPLIEQSVPGDEPQYVSKGLAFGRLRREGRIADRPALVFSGDGGSVGTGHDYLMDEHVQRMRAGDLAGAAAYALERRGQPSRTAFRRPVWEHLVRVLRSSITRELESLDGPAEPGRKFHLFLMQNDQRRHLDHHFEELDRYRTEFANPFFDSEYLRCVLSVPVDACMRHGFYYRWMKHFPAPVHQVPWQAYPGHLPCPVPLAEADRSALSQWQPTRREVRLRVRGDFHTCASHVPGSYLPAACNIGRGRALAVLALHALGLKNGAGLFRAVNEYHRYLERSEGRLVPLPSDPSGAP